MLLILKANIFFWKTIVNIEYSEYTRLNLLTPMGTIKDIVIYLGYLFCNF